MKCPKISVIIPVYNVEKYLKECLDSVINQTFNDIEIICIDDGSTDTSYSILEEYAKKDNRFVILKQENRGAGVARNKGIEVARGEYLYFLDSDDFIDCTLLEKAYIKIKENDSDICIFKTYFYNDKTKKITINWNWENKFDKVQGKKTFNAKIIPNEIFLIFTIPAFTKLYSKSFIMNNSIRFQEIKTCNDVFFNFYTLACANSISFLNEHLVNYRSAQINNLTSNRARTIECIQLAFNLLKQKLIENNLFDMLQISYYKIFAWCVDFEVSLLPTNELKKEWCTKLLQEVPKKYWTPDLAALFENKFVFILKKLFSIIYYEKNKVYKLTILGLKFKIKVL